MKKFKVLDREQNIHSDYLIEASAGTGKTFSIENIVVRLLVEEPSLDLEQILVVTFTRAATRDLKTRIRKNIERCLDIFPDYWKDLVAPDVARKKLEKALLYFDQAQIFTIHGFCARILNEYVFEGDLPIDAISIDDPLSQNVVVGLIRDFFRTGITPDKYGEVELRLVLKEYRGDLERLEKALREAITQGLEIEGYPPFASLVVAFDEKMRTIKKRLHLDSQKIIDDFALQAPSYKGLCNRQREVKAEVLERVARFAELFDQTAWHEEEFGAFLEDGLFMVAALDAAKVSSRTPPPPPEALNYPDLTTVLQQELAGFINPTGVFARMAHDCQVLFRKYLEKEEKFGFDDILKAMKKALGNATFTEKVQSKYRAAIVDEFQDTDPIQWEIFRRLFSPQHSSWNGFLYLVGDPKQSIYSFRQADIYTYLAAATEMGEENRASLEVNYRSQPALIHALNVLFSEKTTPGWMALPGLSYCDVGAPPNAPQKTFGDNRGCVHFFVAEDDRATTLPLEQMEREHFLPFMVQEIQRLAKEDGLHYSHFAVLVADRFQAARTANYLKGYHIPCILQRSGSLAESPALTAWIDLLRGVLHPRHESSLKTALGGKILRWTHDDIRALSDPQALEQVMYPFLALRNVLTQQGFTSFYQHLMQTRWDGDELTALERLLAQEGSAEFYDDLQQIAELLFEFEVSERPTPEGLISYLAQLKNVALDEDKRVKKLLDPTTQAVNIMTLHASKGLEFDIVFTLGLVKRSRAPGMLLPVTHNGERRLSVVPDKTAPAYLDYCQELDAEKMRQLYVAMTRARYRLYNPVAVVPRSRAVELGCASPMELFLGKLSRSRVEQGEFFARFTPEDGITYTALRDTPPVLTTVPERQSVTLQAPPNIVIPGVPRFIHSFSSLNTKHAVPSSERHPPHDFDADEKTPHTLPSGSETGNLLHKMFEKIPFSRRPPEELADCVAPFTAGTPFHDWNRVLAEIFHQTMVTPLTQTFCLADVDPAKCFWEAEFLYASQEREAPGYVKGFIDFTFEHQGKYYLLDWKSNWLGEGCQDYHQDALTQAMEEHNYYFQAQIYKDALKRYLPLVDKRPFEEAFGGVFYIFLRGLSPTHGNEFGVLRL